jgi:hypothetical protein
MLKTSPATSLRSGALGAVCLLLVSAGVAAAQPAALALDAETTIAGVDVACTGIGQTRLDPRWAAYPVRIEFSNARSEYLTDGEIALSDARGRPILDLRCDGPWILLKLKPGAYRVEGRIANAKPRTARFRPPSQGQMRLVLQVPDG